MRAGIKLEKYQGLGRYDDWLALNIEGVYQRISLQRRGN